MPYNKIRDIFYVFLAKHFCLNNIFHWYTSEWIISSNQNISLSHQHKNWNLIGIKTEQSRGGGL